jgi:glycosyltransferase involved in cell wall biosynthesis
MTVAIVHDYLTQRRGAERVVLAMSDAFPSAPIYTSLYDPMSTFDEFADRDIRTLWLDRIAPLRRHHRVALPLLAPAFSSLRVDADVVLCSSSGWAHAVRTSGRKIVYCYSPAKWLYRPDEYLGSQSKTVVRAALGLVRRPLRAWDVHAARTADVYIAISSAIARQILVVYGRRAEVLPPPIVLDANGPRTPVEEVEPGFFLSVARLLPYKNVDRVVEAFSLLPDARLVVVGSGPDEESVRSLAPPNVCFLADISDAELCWLYENCLGLVAASYEDFGLTPLEAAAFGKPTAALRAGGFLDTVVDGETGVFFESPTAEPVAAAVRSLVGRPWDPGRIRTNAARFSEQVFAERLREIVFDRPG